MALYEITADHLTKIAQTTSDQAGLRERPDLQCLLKKQIEVISPDTLIIAEEFGEWEESKRRIDLLGLFDVQAEQLTKCSDFRPTPIVFVKQST